MMKYVYGALAAIGGALLLVLKIVTMQRDSARDRADMAEIKATVTDKQREKEQAITAAQHAARKEATEIADKERERIAAGGRPDVLGDPRLSEKN